MSFSGMGRSIDPMWDKKAGGRPNERPPSLIVSMSLQPVIPWRVALQQSPPPLGRLAPSCGIHPPFVEQISANGNCHLFLLTH
jgi:hypothetical protein